MPIKLTLTGTVIDHTSTQGLPGLEVQIWSTQAGTNAPFAIATTDASGQFIVKFNFEGQRLARSLQFEILQAGRQLELAEDKIVWGGRNANRTVTIPVVVTTPRTLSGSVGHRWHVDLERYGSCLPLFSGRRRPAGRRASNANLSSPIGAPNGLASVNLGGL